MAKRKQTALVPQQPREPEQLPATIPRFKTSKRKRQRLTLEADTDNRAEFVDQLMRVLGTSSVDFAESLLRQLALVRETVSVTDDAAIGPPDAQALNAALAFVAALKPRNELEATLAVQMVTVHALATDSARRAALPSAHPKLRDLYLRHFERLTTTYTKQLDALRKLRGQDKQTMRIEHVHVNAGGQAVVGQVGHPPKPTA